MTRFIFRLRRLLTLFNFEALVVSLSVREMFHVEYTHLTSHLALKWLNVIIMNSFTKTCVKIEIGKHLPVCIL